MTNANTRPGAMVPAARHSGSRRIDPKATPEMARFLSLDMKQQMKLINAVAKFSNDHCLFIVGPDKPSRLIVDGVAANREMQPFRVGNTDDASKVNKAAKWWTWTAEVRLKLHYMAWFDSRDEAVIVHGLINIALDGEGFPISSDLNAWHDVPLAKIIEVIERCADIHGARMRTNEQRMEELKVWAAQQFDQAVREQAIGGAS